jgi:hypothetical protein
MTEPEDDTEPELTDAEKAYNVAWYELFQLAAYGHHRYNPLRDPKTGCSLSIRQIEEGSRVYREHIRRAQENLEGAILLKAIETLTTSGAAACPNGSCCRYDAIRELAERVDELLGDSK